MIQNDKYFYNWTAEDFEWKLDGKPYTFKAGSVNPMTTAEFDHFAKHLTDRELTKAGLRTNDVLKREEFLKRCGAPAPAQPDIASNPEIQIPSVQIVEPPAPPAEEFADLKEEKKEEAPKSWCDTCSSKGRRHKLGCPKRTK